MGQNLHFQDLAGKDPVKKEVKKKKKKVKENYFKSTQ